MTSRYSYETPERARTGKAILVWLLEDGRRILAQACWIPLSATNQGEVSTWWAEGYIERLERARLSVSPSWRTETVTPGKEKAL